MVKVTSTNPYYDDFNVDKQFYRILFKPAVAVQARELTQLQTILQNQLSVMGDHIFENGTRISGGELNIDNEVTYLKVSSVYDDNVIYISNFMNSTIVGKQSGAIGKVIHFIEAENEDVDTLYIKNINGIDFIQGEDIYNQDTRYTTSILRENSIGLASICGLNEGYYYYDGTFVRCNKQQIVLDKYSNNPTYRVGISITSNIITYADDSSLLDPANESTNYGAHGADRLTYNVLLEKRDIIEDENIVDSSEFIELLRTDSGSIVSENKYTQYSELDKYLARRTYDESGNFTVDPFDIKITDSPDNDDNFDIYLGAGKAYIRGYEFETISSSKLTLPKARQTQTTDNYNINAQYGNYCLVEEFTGSFRPSELEEIALTNDNDRVVATANLRYITKESSTTNYRFYIFNIEYRNIGVGELKYTLYDAKYIISKDGKSKAKIIEDEVGNKLFETTYNNLLFQTPHTSVKTLKIDEDGDTNYTTQKLFDVNFQNGVATIKVTDNNTFIGNIGSVSTTIRENHYLIMLNNVINAGSTGLSNGSIINTAKYEVSLSSGNQTATFNVNDSDFQATATIICSVNITHKTERTKILQTYNKVINYEFNKVVNNPTVYHNIIKLEHADIYRLEKVELIETGEDITNHFTLDNGQRDNLYDIGSIIYNGDLFDGEVTKQIKITYSYFEHTGSGYLSVDSYKDIAYSDIPSYKMNDGTIISLRDVIDFRPVRNSDGSFNTSITGFDLPRPASNISADYEFYLSRIDKIILKEDRTFDYIEGVSSINATTPNDRDDAMTLYIIDIPAYTYKLNDINIKYVDNKRYTMRDIGKLDDRVSRLEYLATLSTLENTAKNTITLDENGDNLFKSGILVDSFIGHNVGDLANSDYKCSMDTNDRILRPSIESISLPLQLVESESRDIVNNNGLITPKHQSISFIEQSLSTGTISPNSFNITSWIGHVEIKPSSSLFVDSGVNPDVITNNNNINDGWNLTSQSPYNYHYDYWKTYWYGNQYNNEDDVMLNTDTANNIKKVINNKVINIDILPYVSEMSIDFKVHSMKPNTRVYAYLDSLDITQYLSNSELYTNSKGSFEGKLTIPSGIIRSGTRLLRFIDSNINNLDQGNVTTLAEISFYALGLLNNRTDTMISTLPPLIQRQEIVEDYNLLNATPTRKLLAQSFSIVNKVNGVYIDSLDLYFSSKSNDLPISIEIRPMVDQLPHANKVIPYSQVTIYPEDIKISSDGKVPTAIKFNRPIFLIDGDYAIVIHTNSSEYSLYQAVVGNTITNSVSDSKVSKQLYVGNIFITGNSGVWTSENNKMLKFKLSNLQFNNNSYAVFKCDYPNNEFEYNTFFAHIHNIIQSNCIFNVEYRNRLNGGIFTDWKSCESDKDIDLDSKHYLYNNEDSFYIRVNFINSFESTSSIDLEKCNIVFVRNIINSSDDIKFEAKDTELNPSGGLATARYITKRVTLKEGFDASSLRVIFDSYKPNDTDIKVYYKALNNEDSDLFEDKAYVEMNREESNDLYSVNINDIKEYNYTANSITYNGFVGFKTFAIKIVFLSNNDSIVPFIKNLKVLALV